MDNILSLVINMETLEFVATYQGEANTDSGEELLELINELQKHVEEGVKKEDWKHGKWNRRISYC